MSNHVAEELGKRILRTRWKDKWHKRTKIKISCAGRRTRKESIAREVCSKCIKSGLYFYFMHFKVTQQGTSDNRYQEGFSVITKNETLYLRTTTNQDTDTKTPCWKVLVAAYGFSDAAPEWHQSLMNQLYTQLI